MTEIKIKSWKNRDAKIYYAITALCIIIGLTFLIIDANNAYYYSTCRLTAPCTCERNDTYGCKEYYLHLRVVSDNDNFEFNKELFSTFCPIQSFPCWARSNEKDVELRQPQLTLIYYAGEFFIGYSMILIISTNVLLFVKRSIDIDVV